MSRTLIRFFLMIFVMSQAIASYAAEKDESATKPTYLFNGDAQLLTHYVERGLSITDSNPGLNASFLFNMGRQFRIGFWGSNIANLGTLDDNLWLKAIADIHIDFNSNSIFKLYFHDHHFYRNINRNGQAVGMTLDYKSYTSQLEWMTNFEGSRTDAVYMKVGRLFSFHKLILSGAHLGYTIQKSDEYSNYFDLKGNSTYKVTDFFELEGGATATSHSTQFNGRGNIYLYFGMKMLY